MTRSTVHLSALGLLCALAAVPGHAADLVADGQWRTFDVDRLTATSGGLEWIDIADGTALAFDIVVRQGRRARLEVVDGGFAGDTFHVFDDGVLLGTTAGPGDTYPISVGTDFDTAWADTRFSRGSFLFGPGSHRLHGTMDRSLTLDGIPLEATVGGLRLTVSQVPEPGGGALLLAGLAGLTVAARRRRR